MSPMWCSPLPELHPGRAHSRQDQLRDERLQQQRVHRPGNPLIKFIFAVGTDQRLLFVCIYRAKQISYLCSKSVFSLFLKKFITKLSIFNLS
jgi:hypothetical protein